MSIAVLISSGEAPLRLVPCTRRGRRHLHVVLFLEDVEGHVDVHGAGTPRQHGRHRLPQHLRQHVDASRLEATLDHGADDVREISLDDVLLISWNGLRLNCCVGTLAVMARIAKNPTFATCSGMTILPGARTARRSAWRPARGAPGSRRPPCAPPPARGAARSSRCDRGRDPADPACRRCRARKFRKRRGSCS